jgi:hypothetical protein
MLGEKRYLLWTAFFENLEIPFRQSCYRSVLPVGNNRANLDKLGAEANRLLLPVSTLALDAGGAHDTAHQENDDSL